MRSFRDDIQQSYIPRYGAVVKLMLLNVGVYVLLGALGVGMLLAGTSDWFGYLFRNVLALPADFWTFVERPWTLVTYSLVHSYPGMGGGLFAIFHLVFNMMWLFLMGRILREYLGDRVVYGVYWYGVVVGAFFYLMMFNLAPGLRAIAPGNIVVGSSAGVTALVLAAATLRPTYHIGFMFIGLVQLKWVALIYVILDFLMIMGPNLGGAIAHFGGAFIGYLYIQQRQQGNDFVAPWERLAANLRGIFKRRRPKTATRGRLAPTALRPQRAEVRSSSPKPANFNQGPAAATSKQTEAIAEDAEFPSEDEVNRILEKIHAVGYDRLTKAEKHALFLFSQK